MIKEDIHSSNGKISAPSGLERARLSLAISAGKLAGASGRLLRIGGGTSFPGLVARRIDPDVLKSVVGASKARKIVITGSNGKTTTARMTAAMAASNGKSVSHNRAGANMLQGVTSVAVNFVDISVRLHSDVLLFEIDEGTMPLAMPEIAADVVVITNIFREHVLRHGELYPVAIAVAIGASLAAGFEKEKLPPALVNIKPAFGRLEKIQAGDQTIYLSFVKNPTSFNLILRLIAQHSGQKHILLAASHTIVDGEDFSWLWDIELEEIAPDILDVVCSGNKPEEIAMRLKYAEIPIDKISQNADLESALDQALKNAGPGGTLYILSSYTPTNELRRIMQKRGWVKHVWQE